MRIKFHRFFASFFSCGQFPDWRSSSPTGNDVPDSECSAPDRQRAPTRVTFTPKHAPRVTFSVRGRVVELVNDDAEEQAVPR